ncbi:MAG: hypothetical protein M3336_16685 [Chloroflexota bacterium]|nr:hypothetical protein [Chloroflexota bacterium]
MTATAAASAAADQRGLPRLLPRAARALAQRLGEDLPDDPGRATCSIGARTTRVSDSTSSAAASRTIAMSAGSSVSVI